VKPATADNHPSTASQVVKTTTTRIVPVADSERRTPELWPYLESLNANPSEWDRHLIYIYRTDPSPSVPVEKCQRYITMPDGQQVSMGDEDAVTFALMQKFGGKVFRVIVKRGAERVTEGRVYIDAPPRPILVMPDTPGQGTPRTDGTSDAAQIANKAIDTMANQEHQAFSIGVSALNAAANVVERFANKGNGGGENSMMDRIMALALERLLNPPDPVAQFVAIFTAMKQLSPPPSAVEGSRDPLVNKILETGLDRVLNPAPTGAPVSASAELMRQIPQIASTAADALREFRMAREAELAIVTTQRGGPPVAPSAQVIPPAIPQTATAAPPANGAPTMEFIEKKIIEILHQPISASQAADETLAFLDALDDKVVPQLAALGEQGLVSLFQNRPVLRQAMSNPQRLIEFIREFLKMHSEDLAAAAAEASATGVRKPDPPPLAN